MRYLTDGKRHLICEPYSIENLHLMAKILNINICFYHPKGRIKHPHYDIPKRRIKEIEAKCEIISDRELVRIIKEI